MDRVSLRSIRATLALMVMRSIYQGKCRSVTWVERRETFGAALAWPARTMAKRSRGAPAPEFLFTNATICLPETKAERRKRHVARMSVSEIRGGHSSFQLVPGFHGACHRAGHFGPDPLVHPGYKFIRLQRREAERRQTRISNLRTPTFILAASGRTEEGARRASIGTRSPVGVPPRHLLRRTNATAQLRLRASWDVALTGVTHLQPVPVQRAPRRPVIMPAGRIPEAARERSYEPRPQEPQPLRQSAVTGDVPRTSRHCDGNINGDKCQRKCDECPPSS
jgi:hypothetical protein